MALRGRAGVPRLPHARAPAEALRGRRARGARDAAARARAAPRRGRRRHPDARAGAGRRARGRARARRSSPTSTRAPSAAVPPYSIGARLPRTAAGRALWRALTRADRRAGSSSGARELNETRRRLGLARAGARPRRDLARLCAGGDLPAARVPARRGRRPRRTSSGRCCGSRRSATSSCRPATSPLVLVAPVDVAGPDAPAAARALRGLAGRARARARDVEPPAAGEPDRRARQRAAGRVGLLLADDAARATSSSATAATARSRGRWPAGCAVVVVPAAGDMNENAARIDWAGVGVRVPRRLCAPAARRPGGRASAARRRACASAQASGGVVARPRPAGAGLRAHRGLAGLTAADGLSDCVYVAPVDRAGT